MLFMSLFTSPFKEPLCPPQVYYSPALGFNSILLLPSSTGGGGERGTAKSGKKDEVSAVHTHIESNRSKHFQACITGS